MLCDRKRRIDAAARLRYAAAIRTRTRRAALRPALVLLGLAGLTAAVALVPHGPATALAALAVARAVHARGRWARARARAGTPTPRLAAVAALFATQSFGPGRRLQATCAAASLCAAVVAIAFGASPLLASIAAAGAAAAFLSGLSPAGAVVLGAGALALAGGGALALAAGLLAAGIAAR